jgi:hypothetical protein
MNNGETYMLNARPQLNGNTVEDFANAYVALTEATAAINRAAKVVMSDVVNGRNYQHLGNAADEHIITDRRRVQADIQKVMALLGEIASDIADIHDIAIGDAR